MTVKPPPDGEEILYTDMLYWCVRVMEIDDPDLGFVAGMLSQALCNGGLTEKQGTWARRIFDKLEAQYRAGDLG